jgi:hypothetical protein
VLNFPCSCFKGVYRYKDIVILNIKYGAWSMSQNRRVYHRRGAGKNASCRTVPAASQMKKFFCGFQNLNSLTSILVPILPYTSFSLNSSWFILYSHFHWSRSCERSHLIPGPCICFRETLGETRCGDISLRPIPSWKIIWWWMYLVSSWPCPLSGKVIGKLLFSRARPVSGNVMGGTVVLKTMSSFGQSDR